MYSASIGEDQEGRTRDRAPRSTWSFTIALGTLTIPVTYPALEANGREQGEDCAWRWQQIGRDRQEPRRRFPQDDGADQGPCVALAPAATSLERARLCNLGGGKGPS